MHNPTPFATGRRFDILCLGRFAVDFYAQQIGARLEDVTTFAKYLGGSSANTVLGRRLANSMRDCLQPAQSFR
jgi:5-dehydro-2-deoxygluconokinase